MYSTFPEILFSIPITALPPVHKNKNPSLLAIQASPPLALVAPTSKESKDMGEAKGSN